MADVGSFNGTSAQWLSFKSKMEAACAVFGWSTLLEWQDEKTHLKRMQHCKFRSANTKLWGVLMFKTQDGLASSHVMQFHENRDGA